MNERIKELAEQVGFQFDSLGTTYFYGGLSELLERFAELVRQDEREACAKVCDEWSKTNWTFYDFAKEIRARGDKHD